MGGYARDQGILHTVYVYEKKGYLRPPKLYPNKNKIRNIIRLLDYQIRLLYGISQDRDMSRNKMWIPR